MSTRLALLLAFALAAGCGTKVATTQAAPAANAGGETSDTSASTDDAPPAEANGTTLPPTQSAPTTP